MSWYQLTSKNWESMITGLIVINNSEKVGVKSNFKKALNDLQLLVITFPY